VRVGAHVSSSGGLGRVPDRVADLGCSWGQIFLSGPTGWRMAPHSDTEIRLFREKADERQVEGVVAHAIYLINLASPDDRIWSQSIDSLIAYRNLGQLLGLQGIVAHLGSHRKLGFEAVQARLFEGIASVLSRSEGQVPLLMEVCAGQGGTIGSRFEEFASILSAMGGDGRLGICLDTAHLLAAGFDLTSADGLDRTIDEIDRTIGMDRVRVLHANDSKTPLGSHIDRHENIGDGFIGAEAFSRIVTHPALRHFPFILEVPGLDDQGPDTANVERLRMLGEGRAGSLPVVTTSDTSPSGA